MPPPLSGILNIAVLANDNPQGLLLACRLLDQASYCRVRVLIGGQLASLLEPASVLMTENSSGDLYPVKTRVLKRASPTTTTTTTTMEESTQLEEEGTPLDVLWLCDWRSIECAWHPLRECHVIFQCSKSFDSASVAPWLLDVCQEDAVIISLQSGLDNLQQLRKVFGRAPLVVPRTPSTFQPLSLSLSNRRQSLSFDATGESRRESASSAHSEEDALLQQQQQQQQQQPGRISLISSRTTSSGGTVRAVAANSEDNNVIDEEHEEEKKPGVVMLAGLLGFGCCAMTSTSTTKTITCLRLTHYGAIVVERLSKSNSLQALPAVLLLERTGFKVRYRPWEETNNWLWGDLVWRSFEAYAATTNVMQRFSLYDFLLSHPVHQRVYAGLLQEALSVLQFQSVNLMDPVSSPFGLGFTASIHLLRLPPRILAWVLPAWLFLRFPLEHRVHKFAWYCDNVKFHQSMAPALNGEIVSTGFENDVSTPLNRAVLASLNGADKWDETALSLPELYSSVSIVALSSVMVGLVLVLMRIVAFVLEVTFLW